MPNWMLPMDGADNVQKILNLVGGYNVITYTNYTIDWHYSGFSEKTFAVSIRGASDSEPGLAWIDQNKSLGFYSDNLGFRVAGDYVN